MRCDTCISLPVYLPVQPICDDDDDTGVMGWPFRVTWRHQSRDHLIPYRPFPIGAWSFGIKLLSLTVSEICNSECDTIIIGMTLPLNMRPLLAYGSLTESDIDSKRYRYLTEVNTLQW